MSSSKAIGTASDTNVTPQKPAEECFKKSQAFLAQAERLALMGSFELDLRTQSLIWSEQLYRNLGLDPRQGITRESFLNMVHPQDRGRFLREVEQSFVTGEILDSEFRCVLSNGEICTLHRRAVPLYDERGNRIGLTGMSQDVTDRKRREEELRNRETLLAQAEQLAGFGSWELDLKTGKSAWSDNRYRLLGMRPREQQPTLNLLRQFLHPDDRDLVEHDLQKTIATGVPLDNEPRFILRDGRVRQFYTRAIPITDDSGTVVRLVGIAQDITERRNEECRLRRSEALLAQAEAIANFGSWEWDLHSGTTILSKQLLRMYGLSSEREWDLERHWNNIRHKRPDLMRQTLQLAIDRCEPFEFTASYRMPDGSLRVYNTHVQPMAGANGRTERVLGVVHDVTNKTRNDEDLHRLSQELIRTQDSERRQLAIDLHESAGQTLAALKMTLANLEDALPEGGDEAREHLKLARGFADDAVREVRVVSYLMHPPLLDDAGLIPALHWYVRGFSDRSGIKATVEAPNHFGRQSQEIETTIFRIVQEALTNVHRYASSPTVTIRLARKPGAIHTEIQDQGCGLPTMHLPTVAFGVGIAGMRERVNQLNGSFEMESTPGRGTTIRAVLPLPPEQAVTDLASNE
jgi:PAS domain S-box-containing protein